jgi:molybdate transport system permease protein
MTVPGGGNRQKLLGGSFTTLTVIYVLIIWGLVLADLLLVGWTKPGREQLWESLHNPEIWHAVWMSIWTSSLAAVISMLIALPAGYIISRRKTRWVKLLDATIDIPIILPPLVFGISLLVFFQRSNLSWLLETIGIKFVHRPAGIVLVQVLIAVAYGARLLKNTFDSIDPRMAAVAQTLGCSPTRAFLTVTLSTARNGVVSAFVMVWARALALYGPIIAFVGATTGFTEVMPTRIYLEMSVGRLEASLTVALMMIFLAILVLLVLKLFSNRKTEMSRV